MFHFQKWNTWWFSLIPALSFGEDLGEALAKGRQRSELTMTISYEL
jgi:hypothetical protein